MKKWKQLLALLLAAALLCCLLAACATQTEGNSSKASSSETDTTSDGDAGATDAEAEDVSADTTDADEDEEMATINFWFFDQLALGSDHGERINTAVNEITEEKINTHVDITFVNFGDYMTKIQLGISGGEQIDVLCLSFMNSIAVLKPLGMLMDATEEYTTYAADALELMQDYMAPYTYDGRIYGIPTLRNYCTNLYILMNREYLEELNLLEQAENMESWTDFEAILSAVNDAYCGDGEYAIIADITNTGWMLDGDKFADIEAFDNLNDTTGCVYTTSDGKIELRQAQKGYQEGCERVAQWLANGWLYPESPYTDVDGDSLMKQHVTFSEPINAECDVESTKSSNFGYDVVAKQYAAGMIKTSTLTNLGIGIPITSEEPEAAAKFINELYINAELMNALIRGQENVDYTVEDGEATRIENQYYGSDFICGNNTLLIPLAGNGADYYERVKEMNASAEISPYLGFTLNLTDDMSLQVSQISAVTDQYQQTIQFGGYTEAMYKEYLAKLEVAGVYDYLDAVAQQVTAWQNAQ